MPVIVNGQRIGNVEIVGEPTDEIAEVWENAVALGTAGFALNLAMIGVLYVLFGRVLDPLTGLAQRPLRTSSGRTTAVRLPRPSARACRPSPTSSMPSRWRSRRRAPKTCGSITG